MHAIDADLRCIVDAARETVRRSGLAPQRIDALYFTGGSTGLAALTERLARYSRPRRWCAASGFKRRDRARAARGENVRLKPSDRAGDEFSQVVKAMAPEDRHRRVLRASVHRCTPPNQAVVIRPRPARRPERAAARRRLARTSPGRRHRRGRCTGRCSCSCDRGRGAAGSR